MSQIEIQYQGEYQLDSTTQVLNPRANVTAATDNMVATVSVQCVFQNLSYSYGRPAGSFDYIDTWTNQDVINHLNAWMEARKL